MGTIRTLGSLVGSGPLLLDFDGPVCSIFADYPAPRIAAELVEVLSANAVAVPPHVRSEPDPLAVLRWTGATCPVEVTIAVEDALSAAELRAARTAVPTPFSGDVIVGANAVAVVSNNSAAAIRAYLTDQGLIPHVHQIIGRAYAQPAKMKPNPEPLLAAIRALGAQAAECTMVGDSLSDIEAARAAKVGAIGYANKPWKIEALAAADAVITSMREIATVIT